MLRRLLYAKNIALWCLVAPFCAIVAVVIGFVDHDWPPVLVSITAIGVVPFGVLGISGWVGILGPTTPGSWASAGSTAETGRARSCVGRP